MLSLTIIFALCSLLAAFSDANHSASAGLRWQLSDDKGWSAQYERLGIKGTIEDQAVISFVEVMDGEYLDDSVLDVFVTADGMVTAQRLNTRHSLVCLYKGQIKNAPTLLDQGLSFQPRTSFVHGSYTCEAEAKSGGWTGTIFW